MENFWNLSTMEKHTGEIMDISKVCMRKIIHVCWHTYVHIYHSSHT